MSRGLTACPPCLRRVLPAVLIAGCQLDFRRPPSDAGPAAPDETARDGAADGVGEDAGERDGAATDATADADAELASDASSDDGSTPADGGGELAACGADETRECGIDFPCLASGPHFTCRGRLPDWPATTRNDGLAGFVVDAQANTVFDRLSGLTWVRSTASLARSYVEAADYCAARGDGYHLATLAEFSSLLNTTPLGAVDPSVFPDGEGAPYWTGTPVAPPRFDAAGVAYRYAVGWAGGTLEVGPSDPNERLRIACVRVTEPRFVASPTERLAVEADLVVDGNTRLVWLRAAREEDVPYSEASRWCEAVQIAGRTWRVPSVAELLSVADSRFAYMGGALGGRAQDAYWTSDLPSAPEGAHYAVNFGRFDDQFDLRVRADVDPGCCAVRCVSGP